MIAKPATSLDEADPASLQKHDIDRLLADASLPPAARRALEIRKLAGKAATKKFVAMLNRASSDGRLRGEYVYYGARTGRFASRGIQMHNLKRQPKGYRFDATEAALASNQPVSLDDLALSVRSMIAAPSGKVILKADFSQVEYRGVCWLAGETERLDALGRGELPYELVAARIRGIPVEAVTPDLRNTLGKPVVLGSGYQLGWTGLQALMGRMGRHLDETEARRAIQVFREAHPAVCQLWRDAEQAAKTALEPRFANCWVPFGAHRLLAFSRRAPWLLLRLPSGRHVRYFQPEIQMREKFGSLRPCVTVVQKGKFTPAYRREQIYGGLIVENATQAMCRDILATALMRLDREKFEIIGHTHDEAILLVDAADADTIAGKVESLMARPISSLPDFPLAADVQFGSRYA
ncbi:DNA polymerase [Roseicella sp. DB1501]|uniref:DNA polymerase n=1 Tax=Roseicella sp. DB1501 TaxID=2730925 RepID=UPI0014922762|nr:DNA polymerase [Roseicella sp. DB1501]NOG69782.1 hypothetical protein [Roseicella sp. DB1501]